MELTEKTLRKFFLDAFEQTVVPRFDSIDSEMSEMRSEVRENKIEIQKLDHRLLELEEKIFPEFAELKSEHKIIVGELDFVKKSGGSKFVLSKIEDVEKFLAEKTREWLQFGSELDKLKQDFKKWKQSQKRKTAK